MSETNDKYYHTKDSVDEYIRLSKGVNGSGLISILQSHLHSGASLLEFGSGPGNDFELLQQLYQVTGSDNSQEFLARLNSRFPTGSFLELDATTIQTSDSFDCIYSNKVLHHLSGSVLKASIDRQLEILNPAGVVCHSFWIGEGSETFKGMFVNYHAEAEIRVLFSEQFEILHLEPYAEFEASDSLLIVARKK